MMMSEFIDRTGFEPTYDEYRQVEEAYYNFDGNKDDFCKAFVSNGGEKEIYKRRACHIAELKSQIKDAEKEHSAEIAKLQKQIEDLKNQLDRELEWKPVLGVGTRVSEEDYQHLLKAAGKTMTEQEAKELIAEECGFSIDKIHILTEVSTYEANKYHLCRVDSTYTRHPVYESTDWNYIRFDCGNFMYEFYNGTLRMYCC